MRIESTMKLYFGGPGSGCHGDNCGRPDGIGEQPYHWHGRPNEPVAFTSGEYKGQTGTVQSAVTKRYSKEANMVRVLLDGYPKPGGWNGQVTVDERTLAKSGEKHG